MSKEQQQQAPVVQTEEQKLALMLFESDKGAISYEVAGQVVKLSYTIVRNFLTKGNGKVADADLVQFIQICKFNQLNPFIGEAYLVKYGDSPAQMVVSKEALMKRAEANPHYQGFEAGIIVKRKDEILYLEGTFHLGEDVLLGGWARVHRDDRKSDIVQMVNLNEYDKKQSTWKEKPSTMIRKVAIVQAMREAFPAQLGAMYTQEEVGVVDVPYTEIKDNVQQEIQQNANAEEISMQGAGSDGADAIPAPRPESAPASGKSAQAETKQTPFDLNK